MPRFSQTHLHSIRPAVCAVGYIKTDLVAMRAAPDESHFHFAGSGFLVAPGRILTAGHVIRDLFTFVKERRISKDMACAVFDRPRGDHSDLVVMQFITTYVIDDPINDLGIIEVWPPEDWSAQVMPLAVQEASRLRVGDEIAVFGFPQGVASVERVDKAGNRRLYRLGPVLQQGYVSAIAPTDEASHVSRYLLDINTSRGMSGGPVVDPATGTIVGLHTSGLSTETAFAYPLSCEFVDHFLLKGDPANAARDIEIGMVRQIPV